MKTISNNETKKTIRKSVKVTVDEDVKYIVIYEVRAKKLDGETITTDRYLNKKDAEQKVDFNGRNMKDLYEFSYIYEQWVWC